MHIHGTLRDVHLIALHRSNNLLPGEDPPRATRQQVHNTKFEWRQSDRLALHAHLMTSGMQDQGLMGEHRIISQRFQMLPAQQGYLIEPKLLANVAEAEQPGKATELVNQRFKTHTTIARVEPVFDESEDEITGYMAYTKP